MPSAGSRRTVLLTLLVLTGAGLVAGWLLWRRPPRLPQPGSPLYEQYDDLFQRGLAGLDADIGEVAEPSLTEAVGLVPEEPAAWANRGLFHTRHNQMEQAARDLEQARRLAPDNPQILQLTGIYEQARGRFSEAADAFRRALEGNPRDLQALYQLAKIIDQEQRAGSDAEYQKLLERILDQQPNNLHVLLDRLNRAVRRGDRPAVDETFARLGQLSAGWQKESRDALARARDALAGPLGPDAAFEAVLLMNLLKQEPAYARSLDEVDPDKLPGKPIASYLRLAPPPRTPAPADLDLTFTAEPLPGAPPGPWPVTVPMWLTGEGPPAVLLANGKEVRQAGGSLSLPAPDVAADGVLPLDWNNDFRTDLLLAGRTGLRWHEQDKEGRFADATARTGLPAELLQGDYFGAWARDFDADGDLDVLLARRAGPPVLLRNNADGTFTPREVFPGIESLRAFAWVDLDADGAPDAALLDAAGRLFVFANERSGQFRPWPAAPPEGRTLALAVMDADDDGILDLAALRGDGAVVRLSDRGPRAAWDTAELVRGAALPVDAAPDGRRLLAADFDNNGALDLVISGPEGSRLWLGEGGGRFSSPRTDLPPARVAAVDARGAARLDLLATGADGRPLRLRNAGTKDYHWQALRLRARPLEINQERSQWMNTFALGSEVEVRAGPHVLKQPVEGPVVHFGLGTRARPSVIRAQWTSGRVNSFWDQPVDQDVVAVQRGYVSCPFLFTWDGERHTFVTDFMWSSPLGVPDSSAGQDSFPVQTVDWVRVRGSQLVPRDGVYEVRVLANLWETHYYDHLSLRAVDHPADTELVVDERASAVPAPPAFHLLDRPRPVARAWDHQGRDVTARVVAADGVYLDGGGRGPFQGISAEHWVEVELGDEAPASGPVWLVARGWVLPVDSSAYFALAQGRHPQPREPALEVPDGRGGWKVARAQVGYPAGKDKTILVRLDGADGPGVPRRFRLRTNLAVCWDCLQVAGGRDDGLARVRTLPLGSADLHFRGVLDLARASDSSPELPRDDRPAAVGQPWRNLAGYYTRYGDVRELLERVDDRYAILTAGDEMTLSFPAPPGPPPGWVRDFIWAADGWTKDGDLNTRFSGTVLPLPAHDLPDYRRPPGRLEDDPVYRRHARDWQVYHTRYVTPAHFARGLRPR